MMKTKHATVIAGLAVAVGCAIAWTLMPESQDLPAQSVSELPTAAATSNVPTAQETTETPADAVPPLAQSDTRTNDVKPADVAQDEPPIMINGYELQDPLARVALNFVGADPEAEAYWIGAINDASMPAEERKDLIEDLNEDGLSDPRHPTAQDLPLIISRMRLIQRLMPSAMDDVNRDALLEAYKDLLDLANGRVPQ